MADEIQAMQGRFGVSEFHIEDVNPTLDRRRTLRLSRNLIERKAAVTWKLAQGTKLESLDEETIRTMARAGCRYVSFSPESGSPCVLERMGKPVDLEYAVKVARWLKRSGIYSQSCFVIGYPGETAADRRLTAVLVRRLRGLGSTKSRSSSSRPTPGSRIYTPMGGAGRAFEDLTFTSTWREDYGRLAAFRKRDLSRILPDQGLLASRADARIRLVVPEWAFPDQGRDDTLP